MSREPLGALVLHAAQLKDEMIRPIHKRICTRTYALVLGLILTLHAATGANAQQYASFVSPGVSLGYLFGPNGGTVLSFEVSATYWPSDRFYYGAVSKLQLFSGNVSVHVGGEGGHAFLGASVGPTWSWIKGERSVGFSTSVYTLAMFMPYYTYHWYPDRTSIDELGCYLKIPMQLAGPHVGWRN